MTPLAALTSTVALAALAIPVAVAVPRAAGGVPGPAAPPRTTAGPHAATGVQAASPATAPGAGRGTPSAARATPQARGQPNPGRTGVRTGWTWPLAPRPAVLRGFAIGPSPWSPGHRGVDLGARHGMTVLAPAAGVVAYTGVVAGRPVMSIAHAGGVWTTYEPVVASLTVGTAVAPGDPVGSLADATGHCPGRECLHWGARIGDRYVDPLRLLDPPEIVLLPLRAATG